MTVITYLQLRSLSGVTKFLSFTFKKLRVTINQRNVTDKLLLVIPNRRGVTIDKSERVSKKAQEKVNKSSVTI